MERDDAFFDHERLDVYRLSINMPDSRFVWPISFHVLLDLLAINGYGQPQSISLNIAEGNGKSSLSDKAAFLKSLGVPPLMRSDPRSAL